MDSPSTGPRGRGVSLIETCVCLAILALLAGQALPALQRLRQQVLLRAVTDALGDDIRLARAEAVRLNRPVFLRISGKGTAACYVLHLGARNACDCAGGRAECQGARDDILKAVWLPAGEPVRLSSNVESMQFLRAQGTVTPTGSIDVHLDDRHTIRLKVAITGRVKSCYPRSPVARLPAC